jgi:hypothetical protein
MLSLRKKIQGSCKLDGHTLEQVPSNPYLGVQIQEDLKWKEHTTVASFENSPSRATHIFRFVKNVVNHACRGPLMP